MAERGRTSSPGSEPGRRQPRHRFFLNANPEERFGTCPRCGMSTGHRKVVLAVVVQPHHLVTLSVTCRTCSRCDLLIAHQADVAVLLTELFREHDPSVIGNDYAVAGTLDRAEWEQSIDPPSR